ncbi:MAG TPA: hypothetical protein PLP22_12515, partial [Candidatus Competibacter sp.]|nr:hypothetical protein [Candidatus Competibacter sp.]
MFLLVLGGIWLVSPVIFMIALIVSRSQIRMLRERLADRQESVGSVSPEPVAPVLRVGAEPSPYRESEPLFEASPG